VGGVKYPQKSGFDADNTTYNPDDSGIAADDVQEATHHNDDGATALKNGTLYVDSGTNKLVLRLNGGWETVTSA